MRTFVLTLVFLLSIARTFPQGMVDFQNNSSTRLTTNDFQGNVGFTSGVNAYRFGLYIAPQGTTDPNAFTLMGPTTLNLSGGPGGVGNGRFNGNPPSGSFVISNNTGQTIAFQIRAWSLFAGNSWEESMLYAGPETVYLGRSTIGQVTPATGLASTPSLFGPGFGQVSEFTLTPLIVPEPSTVALAVVGAGVLWCATRRRKKSLPRQTR